jgi:hypothetical protein
MSASERLRRTKIVADEGSKIHPLQPNLPRRDVAFKFRAFFRQLDERFSRISTVSFFLLSILIFPFDMPVLCAVLMVVVIVVLSFTWNKINASIIITHAHPAPGFCLRGWQCSSIQFTQIVFAMFYVIHVSVMLSRTRRLKCEAKQKKRT